MQNSSSPLPAGPLPTPRWRMWSRSLLDFVYPPACRMCGRDVPLASAGATALAETMLCTECVDTLAPTVPHACQRCGAPVGPHLDSSGGCVHCHRDRFAFRGVSALGVYRQLLASVCRQEDRGLSRRVMPAAARLLFDRQADRLQATAARVIIPVPLHWTHRLIRLDHPPEIIGRELARCLRIPLATDLLFKTRRTTPQRSLTPTGRRSNLRRAFAARLPARYRNQPVLLVDDVLTTGTTAHECTRALHAAGAGEVFVAVLARGVGRTTENPKT